MPHACFAREGLCEGRGGKGLTKRELDPVLQEEGSVDLRVLLGELHKRRGEEVAPCGKKPSPVNNTSQYNASRASIQYTRITVSVHVYIQYIYTRRLLTEIIRPVTI